MPDDSKKLSTPLDPRLLDTLRELTLLPKITVNSRFSGIHAGEKKGTDVEFAEHRHYEPGDDLRYLDWNALAKSDEMVLKQFESETRVTGRILIDSSKSMDFTSVELSKWEMARALAVIYASILLQQRDRVKISTTSQQQVSFPNWEQFSELITSVDTIRSLSPCDSSDLLPSLRREIKKATNKNLWIIISDFWLKDTESFFHILTNLKNRGHQLIMVPVWDPLERHFEPNSSCMLRDNESGETIELDKKDIENFNSSLRRSRQALKNKALEHGFYFYPFYNDRDPLQQLRYNLASAADGGLI